MDDAPQQTQSGRVLRVDAKVCHVQVEAGVIQASPRGHLFENLEGRKNPIAVGDFVDVSLEGNPVAIESVHERRNYLGRTASSHDPREQILVANADQLFILKFLGTFELGLYALACKMLLLPISSINAVFNRVLFPLYSRIQDDDARLRNAFLKTTATIALVVFPCLVGFAMVADSLVAGILPASWLPIVPLTGALAIVGLVQSVATSSGTIYMAKGRTDLLLLWTIATGVFAITGFAIGVQWGALGVARAYAVLAGLLLLPGMALVLRLIDTSLSQFLAACWRPLCCALVMGVGIWAVGRATLPALSPLQDLAVRIPIGITLYLVLSLALNREHLREVIATARRQQSSPAPTLS